MTTEETKQINAEFYAKLESSPQAARAVDAIYEFTRSLMYHKFTGMPVRGFMRRIMPAQKLYRECELAAIGLTVNDCNKGYPLQPGEEPLYSPWWPTDTPLYEVIEDRLDREDCERRLAARTVPKYEWQTRYRSARRRTKESHARKLRIENLVDGLLTDFAAAALHLARKNHG